MTWLGDNWRTVLDLVVSHLYLAGRSFIPTHNSDLLLGLALTKHRQSVIYRREFPQLKGMIARSRAIVGAMGRYNKTDATWILRGGQALEFGSVQYEEDREKWQGRPHDLVAFDELSHFSRSQYRFLTAWNRSTVPGQRCRVVCTGNPPTPGQGVWIIEEWAPWLDATFARPAVAGELRWYAVLSGRVTWLDSGEPFEHQHDDGTTERIYPRSRTFIPARVADNPYLARSSYIATLQALPEPLRSQLLRGDFAAAVDEDPWQVIPTAWVREAQRRWADAVPAVSQTCLGVDVAHGGPDQLVVAPRYGTYIGALVKVPGRDVPTGRAAAEVVMRVWQQGAYINVDAIGYGASCQERLAEDFGVASFAVNSAERSEYRDRSGKYRCVNVRAEAYWRLREALDPETGIGLMLPPDKELRKQLRAIRWKLSISGIQIEEKKKIEKDVGSSIDRADAVAYAMYDPGTIESDKDIYKQLMGR